MSLKTLPVRRNITLLALYSFFIELRFINVISILYYTKISGSYALGMSIFAIASIAGAFFEIPSGIFSDKIGRKWTLVFGALLDVIACSIEAFAGLYNSYSLLVIGTIIGGVCGSFYSGTDDALRYETLTMLRKKHKYHELSGKYEAIMQLASGSSALIGGFLAYFYSYTFAAFATVVPMLILFVITLLLVEPDICSSDKEHSSFSHFILSIKNIYKNKKLLRFSIAEVINIAFGDNSHRFQVALFQGLVPVWLLGILRSLKQFGGVVGAWYAGRIIDKFGHYDVLFFGKILAFAVKNIALLSNSFITPFIYSLMNLIYQPANISMQHIMQNEFSNNQRATMGSILALLYRIASATVGIFIGWVADKTSPLVALYVLTVPEILTIYIYKTCLNKYKSK